MSRSQSITISLGILKPFENDGTFAQVSDAALDFQHVVEFPVLQVNNGSGSPQEFEGIGYDLVLEWTQFFRIIGAMPIDETDPQQPARFSELEKLGETVAAAILAEVSQYTGAGLCLLWLDVVNDPDIDFQRDFGTLTLGARFRYDEEE